MDSRPPSLLPLLISLLRFWQCARGQSSYTINTVGLAILPGSTVQSGTPVILRCQVSVSQENITQLTHTFTLKRDDIPIHSATTTEDTVTYELNPARATDSGSYECRVTVKDKSKSSFSQKLDITGLQTPILYLNKTTPYEDEEFKATCSAPEEKGSLVFRFYQIFNTGQIKMIKQPAPTGNSSETTLVLRQVGDSFLYCDYEISLVSGTKRSNSSNQIQVIVKELYISPIVNVLPSRDVFEGDVIEVVCRVVSSLKNVEVFLTRDRRILKQAPVSLSHRFTAQEGDSGELVCKAEWGNVQKETYTTITVRELFSKPRLTLEPMELFERNPFKLTCSVSVYVPERISNDTIHFSIYRDNVKIASVSTYLAMADPHKNGNYTCKAIAASLAHNFVKESQTVVVKAKIPVSKPVLSVVGGTLVLGKHFQLLCHSDYGTLPIVYTLHGPDGLLGLRVVDKLGDQAVFNCSAIHRSSVLNNFRCHAKNSLHNLSMPQSGQLLRSTNIIEPVSKPVLTTLPSVEGISEEQDLTLICSVQKGTPPISFTWYRNGTKEALASQTSRKLEESYRISSVKGEHQGGYYCASTNPANETQRSQTLVIGVKLAGWKKGLIAVFCILFILVLILVIILLIIFKKHLLPFKRKRTGKLSVKSAGTNAERLSLTQAEVNKVANVTPGMIGKSVWSENVSCSESDDQNSVSAAAKQEPQYTEVQTSQAGPDGAAPVKKGTDTVYSEVRNSNQGVPEQADGVSVEYAQLNHDADHHSDQGNHGDHSVQDGHTDKVDSNTADCGE